MLVAQLLCRELTQENECLRTEHRILRSKLPRRIPFTDEERRALADAALVMSRKLMRQVVSIIQPNTVHVSLVGDNTYRVSATGKVTVTMPENAKTEYADK